ncbi:hypothetical protein BDV95DRAFT_595592 [Massariosphaeria phaeospora]|uniref:Uncharacterized protein n=1 Tax=Massariosphaeria phaeospora TaxID=100035 RepID=A0A7C8M6L6_9PLEO|nr:hypothetical protein BDV95DRAFT_595592 [Massariosphaeria phaeospora]
MTTPPTHAFPPHLPLHPRKPSRLANVLRSRPVHYALFALLLFGAAVLMVAMGVRLGRQTMDRGAMDGANQVTMQSTVVVTSVDRVTKPVTVLLTSMKGVKGGEVTVTAELPAVMTGGSGVGNGGGM